MNSSLSRFWIGTAAFLTLCLGAVGFIVWDSYPNSTDQKTMVSEPQKEKNTTSKNNGDAIDIQAEAPSLPAPAKKLQKLVNSEDASVIEDKQLQDRLSKLDKQLEGLNQELQKQGSIVSELPSELPSELQADQVSRPDDPTKERLEAIRKFISEKEVNQTSTN